MTRIEVNYDNVPCKLIFWKIGRKKYPMAKIGTVSSYSISDYETTKKWLYNIECGRKRHLTRKEWMSHIRLMERAIELFENYQTGGDK